MTRTKLPTDRWPDVSELAAGNVTIFVHPHTGRQQVEILDVNTDGSGTVTHYREVL